MPHLQGQCRELLGGGRIDWAGITVLLILFAMGEDDTAGAPSAGAKS